MLKRNIVKILSTAIIFAVLIGIVITISGAARTVPEKTFEKLPVLEPDVIFGSKGENILPNNIETDGENEEEPPKEEQKEEIPENIPESIPETPEEKPSENQKPETLSVLFVGHNRLRTVDGFRISSKGGGECV